MPNEADTKGQNEPRIGRGGVGETWGEETIESLMRRIAELEAELERARLHNIQLLRRKPKHSCIGGP